MEVVWCWYWRKQSFGAGDLGQNTDVLRKGTRLLCSRMPRTLSLGLSRFPFFSWQEKFSVLAGVYGKNCWSAVEFPGERGPLAAVARSEGPWCASSALARVAILLF